MTGASADATAQQQPVLVLMGVSGCGKSTVAAVLAGQLGWDLEEGDDLHPAGNVAKMAAGLPLTDEDRWPWLDLVARWIQNHTVAGIPGIVTCSALKKVYRDRLRGDNVVFVHLAGSKEQIGQRLAARTDHFMPVALLDSQVATLEPLGARRELADGRFRSQARRCRRGDHRVTETDSRGRIQRARVRPSRPVVRTAARRPVDRGRAAPPAGMRALKVHGAGDLRLDDLARALAGPRPNPGAGHPRRHLRIGLHYFRHGAVGAFTLREPLVLGHEVVGRIAEDPSGASAVDTPVAIHLASPCGACPQCARRRAECVPERALPRVGRQRPAHPGRIRRVHPGPARPGPPAPRLAAALPRRARRTRWRWPSTPCAGPAESTAQRFSSAGPARSACWWPAPRRPPVPPRCGPPTCCRTRCHRRAARRRSHSADRRRARSPTSTSTWPSRPLARPARSGRPWLRCGGAGCWCSWECSRPALDPPSCPRWWPRRSTIAVRSGSTPNSTTRSPCSPERLAFDPVITHTFDLSDAVSAMEIAADPAISGKVVLQLDAG